MRRAAAPGFTLIELMIAVAVALFVIAGIFLAFSAQASNYAAEQRQMAAQSGSREGLDLMAEVLRNAGYGVDPHLALLAYDGFNAAAAGQTSPDPAYPDAVVVHARDLDFQRGVVTAAPDSIHFSAPLGTVHPGQIFLLLCSGAAETAYVTALEKTADDTVSLQAASVVTLDSPTGWPGPQFHQEAKLNDPCFARPDVVAVRVKRWAFFVRAYADDPSQPNATTPYLMLSQGLDLDGSGAVDLADAVPLAPNVEQLQVAYLMDAVPPTCPSPAIHGVTDSPPWGTTWITAGGPSMDTPYTDPSRCTSDVANVRQVRVTLVARAGKLNGAAGDDAFAPDAGTGVLTSGTVAWKPLENLSGPSGAFAPRGGGYQRTVLRISVATPNLAMRSQFLPTSNGG